MSSRRNLRENGQSARRWGEEGAYLFLVSVDVDEVEGEDVVLGPHQQPPPLLVQQESVVARAVGQAVEGDEVTRL